MNDDPELTALSNICAALSSLDAASQQRVLDYAARKFGLLMAQQSEVNREINLERTSEVEVEPKRESVEARDNAEDTDGISPVAVKWMRRNGFTVNQLGHLFSLGTEDVDLVSNSVPGSSKNARTRAVVLLKGISAYLSTGVARVTAEQIKEACLHYDAYDSPNHAKYLKGMLSEVTGGKASGYTLTARGIAAATDVIRGMLAANTE